MKIDVPDELLPLIVAALEHQYAYSKATEREDARYLEAAELFKRAEANSDRKHTRR